MEFFEMYKRDQRDQQIPEQDWGSESSFRVAYALVKDKLLLQGSAVSGDATGGTID